jgi:hypothetical protein
LLPRGSEDESIAVYICHPPPNPTSTPAQPTLMHSPATLSPFLVLPSSLEPQARLDVFISLLRTSPASLLSQGFKDKWGTITSATAMLRPPAGKCKPPPPLLDTTLLLCWVGRCSWVS